MEDPISQLDMHAFLLYLEQRYQDALSIYMDLLTTYAKNDDKENMATTRNMITLLCKEWVTQSKTIHA